MQVDKKSVIAERSETLLRSCGDAAWRQRHLFHGNVTKTPHLPSVVVVKVPYSAPEADRFTSISICLVLVFHDLNAVTISRRRHVKVRERD